MRACKDTCKQQQRSLLEHMLWHSQLACYRQTTACSSISYQRVVVCLWAVRICCCSHSNVLVGEWGACTMRETAARTARDEENNMNMCRVANKR
jgi:hypothetical protein